MLDGKIISAYLLMRCYFNVAVQSYSWYVIIVGIVGTGPPKLRKYNRKMEYTEIENHS